MREIDRSSGMRCRRYGLRTSDEAAKWDEVEWEARDDTCVQTWTHQPRQAASIRARRLASVVVVAHAERTCFSHGLVRQAAKISPVSHPPRRVSPVSALSQFLPLKISRGITSPKNSAIHSVTKVTSDLVFCI